MDHLALSVSKAITDFLQQNEKRFEQQQQHDKLLKDLNRPVEQLLKDLNSRVEQLETTCKELISENISLKDELNSVKQKQETATRDMITTKSDHERMQKQVNDCSEWTRLMTALTQKVHCHDESLDGDKKELKALLKNQSELSKQLERQHKLLNATAAKAEATAASVASLSSNQIPATITAPHYSIRTPIRSPSTSSFFNGNMNRNHSSTPRHRLSTNQVNNNFNNNEHHDNIHHLSHYHRSEYNGSVDHNDEMIDEMSDHAESLLKEVDVLKELQQRSFGGSICSDE